MDIREALIRKENLSKRLGANTIVEECLRKWDAMRVEAVHTNNIGSFIFQDPENVEALRVLMRKDIADTARQVDELTKIEESVNNLLGGGV